MGEDLFDPACQHGQDGDCVQAKNVQGAGIAEKRKLVFCKIGENMSMNKNYKVIGTHGQGVWAWCPRELTTEHLTKLSLWLD